MHTHSDSISQISEALSARRLSLHKRAGTAPTERRAQTQNALLAAGRDLITERGIGSTSVGDICSQAGFTRGAFYSNFTDMDHFVRRLAEEQWNGVIEVVDSQLEQWLASGPVETPSPTDITALAHRILPLIPLSRTFYLLQAEFTTYLSRAPKERDALREGYNDFKKHVSQALTTGVNSAGREFVLSTDDTIDLILAAAERSMMKALTQGTDNVTDYLERVLPTLLKQMTAPLAPAE